MKDSGIRTLARKIISIAEGHEPAYSAEPAIIKTLGRDNIDLIYLRKILAPCYYFYLDELIKQAGK